MTKNEDKQDKTDEHWLISVWHSIWQSKKEIEEYAKNYNNTKWYKSSRFIAPLIYFTLTTLSIFLLMDVKDILVYILIGLIAFVSIYFSVKGYRVVMLFIIVFIIIDVLSSQIMYPPKHAPLLLYRLILWGIIIGQYITAYRIERYLAVNGLLAKKRILKDIFMGLILPIVCTIIILFIVVLYEEMH